LTTEKVHANVALIDATSTLTWAQSHSLFVSAIIQEIIDADDVYCGLKYEEFENIRLFI
jgi:hypothetical protein